MKQKLIHLILFLVTFFATTLSGLEWIVGKTFLLSKSGIGFGVDITKHDWYMAFLFSSSFLFILTVHEFGHYFMGIYYKVKVTLPYYIPLWFGIFTPLLGGLLPSIGTMGAFIRIKSPLKTTKEFFDIGIAGPLAGFFTALGIIWYGFATLPPVEYIYNIHPDYKEAYKQYGVGTDIVYTYEYQKERYIEDRLKENPNKVPEVPASDYFDMFSVGDNLLFTFFKWLYADQGNKIPNSYELFHYPFLFAGYLACFFTALNLIPIGQLDGGHVLYGLIGYKNANRIFPYFYKFFLLYAGLGLITTDMPQDELIIYVPLYLLFLNFCLQQLYINLKERWKWILVLFLTQIAMNYMFPSIEGYQGWLLFGLLIGRFLGVKHPPSIIEQDIGIKRKILGIVAVLVFIVCFSPHPFIF